MTEDDIIEQQAIGRNLYRRGYSRNMCENSEQEYGWDTEAETARREENLR